MRSRSACLARSVYTMILVRSANARISATATPLPAQFVIDQVRSRGLMLARRIRYVGELPSSASMVARVCVGVAHHCASPIMPFADHHMLIHADRQISVAMYGNTACELRDDQGRLRTSPVSDQPATRRAQSYGARSIAPQDDRRPAPKSRRYQSCPILARATAADRSARRKTAGPVESPATHASH